MQKWDIMGQSIRDKSLCIGGGGGAPASMCMHGMRGCRRPEKLSSSFTSCRICFCAPAMFDCVSCVSTADSPSRYCTVSAALMASLATDAIEACPACRGTQDNVMHIICCTAKPSHFYHIEITAVLTSSTSTIRSAYTRWFEGYIHNLPLLRLGLRYSILNKDILPMQESHVHQLHASYSIANSQQHHTPPDQLAVQPVHP